MNIKYIIAAVLLLAGLLCIFSGCTGVQDQPDTVTPTHTPAQNVIVTESPVENVVDANNIFAFDMYRQIAGENTDDKNIFFSPFSISSAFALTYEGAKGKTAEEIGSVFHFTEDIDALRNGYLELNAGINAGDPDYELSVANALWAEKTYQFLEDYINTAETYYSANTTNLDFINQPEESRVTINDWAEEKTNGRIEDLIPAGMINSVTKLVITNAIYFKGTWVLPFDDDLTYKADFTTPSGDTVRVDMMQRIDGSSVYRYNETDEFQVLEMPYEHESGRELSMVVLLPKENDLGAIEDALDAGKLKEIENSMRSRQVKVYFPKFTFETEYSLADPLKILGITDAFSNETADFSGMDGTKNLYISDVVHKAFVEVNEEGTEASAATAVMAPGGMAPQEEETKPVFRADHQFNFVIQDDETGNILFIGRISNPAQ